MCSGDHLYTPTSRQIKTTHVACAHFLEVTWTLWVFLKCETIFWLNVVNATLRFCFEILQHYGYDS